MLIVEGKLISRDVVEEQFMCNLEACKGACCWEGDFGAPLEKEELEILDRDYDQIAPFLSEEGKSVISEQGRYTWYEEPKEFGTPLINNGACAYMTYTPDGIAPADLLLCPMRFEQLVSNGHFQQSSIGDNP